jgi:hypothetical protein
VVLSVCSHHQADVYKEGNEGIFFSRLLESYKGATDLSELEKWLDKEIPKYFLSLGERPRWIQGADWPFSKDGYPMIFVGQIDISITQNPVASNFFHDDTSFYTFIPQEVGKPVVVIQRY